MESKRRPLHHVPAVSKMEDICEKWIADLLGLEAGTAVGLVTGPSDALICAFAAAGNDLLYRQGYHLLECGL